MVKRILSSAFLSALLLLVTPGTWIIPTVVAGPWMRLPEDYHKIQQTGNPANPEVTEPTYAGTAEYYDNRKAVVTATLDDWTGSGEKYEECLTMFTEKHIYHTGGIITARANWTNIQSWIDRGYTEAGSHSRSHPHVSYEDYDSEIGGSKDDIMDNLNLPPAFSFNGSEYVYTWIEPHGESDSIVRQKLGYYKYLVDRDITLNDGWATWNSTNGLFNRIGYSIEMGSPQLGGTTHTATLNSKFDRVYDAGGIYHLISHPSNVNWTSGEYADSHTDYIKDRLDVWYVCFGQLYLYRWMATQNVVHVTSTGSGQIKIFKISMSPTDHEDYGARYPLTYVFDIPSDWTSGYAYYRYRETESWILMANKSSEDFFNGINSSRFDFTDHKAYVSVGFGDISHEIYLQLRSSLMLKVPQVYSTIQEAIDAAVPGDTIQVAAGTYHENVAINKSLKLVGDDRNTTIINGSDNVVVSVTAKNVNIRGFTIRNGSPFGIYLNHSHSVIISNNTMSHTEEGIYLLNSSGNTITDNTISNNDLGIHLAHSSGNTIYHNNFIDNTQQLLNYESSNTWDNGAGEGNYWSDYTGKDDGSGDRVAGDGVGDTLLPHQGVDYHPLIYIWPDTTPPVADAGSDQTITEDTAVNLDGSGSSDNAGVFSYEWDFGDGTTGTGATITHTYVDPGTYSVTLTVRDKAGNNATDSATITVLRDTDSDGTPDVTDTDDDNDGMPDVWETENGLDPLIKDASLDPDNDGLTNLKEYLRGTNPLLPDSDGDFWTDPIDLMPKNALIPNTIIIIAVAIIPALIMMRKRK